MSGRAFALYSPRDATRRQGARALLAYCGLDGELWPAIDGASLSSAALSSTVGTGLFAPAYPFPLTTAEIARFLGHRQIWAEIVRQGLDHGLVVEEEAAIEPDLFVRALDLGRAQIDDLGYILFQTEAPRRPARLVDTNVGCALSLPMVSATPSPVQMIGRAAAIHLLHLTETFDRPLECLIQSHWHTGLRAGAIYPSGVSRIAEAPERRSLGQLWAGYSYRRAARHAARHSPAPITGGLA